MITLLTIVHIFVCLFLGIIVLLQHGKGADIGATFGGGSQTVFGSRGAATFLSKLTVACAVVFMLTSLSLAYLSSRSASKSIFSDQKKTPNGQTSAAAPTGTGTPSATATPSAGALPSAPAPASTAKP
jgi:preprotein translocase subunit SecG